MIKTGKGFTLIELMITVAIVAIVLGVAVPSFNTQILNNRSITLGEDLGSALNYVRSEAIRRSARVSICASSDAQTCTGTWTDGFIAFVDYATSDKANAVLVNPAPAPGQEPTIILKVWKKQDARAVITAKLDTDGDGVADGANVNLIRYTSLGTLARINNSPVIIESELTGCANNAARKITIGLSGSVSVERKACTN